MLLARSKREVFIFIYTNEPERFRDYGCFMSTLLSTQHCLTTSDAVHIVVAFPPDREWEGDDEWKGGANDPYMVCYEVLFGKAVTRTKKSLEYYDDKYVIRINDKQYGKLREFLDHSCGFPMKDGLRRRDRLDERIVLKPESFNTMAFFWNFMPILRCCPIRGSGYYCAQLVADAMKYAGIIRLKGRTVKTKGYMTDLLCGCFPTRCKRLGKPTRTVRVPPSYQMTVEMLLDVIRTQNASTFLCLSSETNGNQYAPVPVVAPPRRSSTPVLPPPQLVVVAPPPPPPPAVSVVVATPRRQRRRKRRRRRRRRGGRTVSEHVQQPELTYSVKTPIQTTDNPFTSWRDTV